MTTKVTNSVLANNAVGTDQLQDDAVTAAKIADNAIVQANMADNSVGTAELINLGVTNAKIANDAVTGEKIADNAINSEHITALSVTQGKLAVGSVVRENISGAAVGASQIEDGSISSSHFVEGAVNTAALAAGAVVGSKVTDGSLPLSKMATGPAYSILVRNASGAVVNLAPGSVDGHVLTMLSGVPTWGNQILPAGIIVDYFGTGAPAGWMNCNGTTIGSATSEATGLADNTTRTLYMHLWNSFNNTICPVIGGRGVSADADFTANKPITLPDLRGRTTFGYESLPLETSGRITSATVTGDLAQVGLTGGVEKWTLTEAQMPAHRHYQYVNYFWDERIPTPTSTVNALGGLNPESVPGVGYRYNIGGNWIYSGVVFLENFAEPSYGQTSTVGANNPHPQIPPMMLVSKIIKL